MQETQSQGGGCDGHGRGFAVELFTRSIPQYVKDELQQAIEDNIARDGCELIPVAVWHEKHRDYDDDLVVMRQSDFQKLLEQTSR